jgi:hypothetical protein
MLRKAIDALEDDIAAAQPVIVVSAYGTLIAAAGECAQERFIEFFTANIRNRNTRRLTRSNHTTLGSGFPIAPRHS